MSKPKPRVIECDDRRAWDCAGRIELVGRGQRGVEELDRAGWDHSRGRRRCPACLRALLGTS